VEPHEYVAAAVGTTTLLGLAYRFIIAPTARYARSSLAAHEAVVREFSPNGGHSMRDAIDDIRRHVHRLSQVDHIAMEMSNKAYVETDGDGLCVWANNTYLTMTSMQRHEVLGLGWINAIHPHDRAAVRAEWDSCLEDNRNFQMRFRIANHDECVYSVGMMIRDPDHNVIGAIASLVPLECKDCPVQWRDDLCSK
jgi:PAS domain S-box-containing protein